MEKLKSLSYFIEKSVRLMTLNKSHSLLMELSSIDIPQDIKLRIIGILLNHFMLIDTSNRQSNLKNLDCEQIGLIFPFPDFTYHYNLFEGLNYSKAKIIGLEKSINRILHNSFHFISNNSNSKFVLTSQTLNCLFDSKKIFKRVFLSIIKDYSSIAHSDYCVDKILIIDKKSSSLESFRNSNFDYCWVQSSDMLILNFKDKVDLILYLKNQDINSIFVFMLFYNKLYYFNRYAYSIIHENSRSNYNEVNINKLFEDFLDYSSKLKLNKLLYLNMYFEKTILKNSSRTLISEIERIFSYENKTELLELLFHQPNKNSKITNELEHVIIDEAFEIITTIRTLSTYK